MHAVESELIFLVSCAEGSPLLVTLPGEQAQSEPGQGVSDVLLDARCIAQRSAFAAGLQGERSCTALLHVRSGPRSHLPRILCRGFSAAACPA